MRRRRASGVKAQWQLELDDEQLQRMSNAVKLAESTAPTHPHPGVESATKNMPTVPEHFARPAPNELRSGRNLTVVQCCPPLDSCVALRGDGL